MRLFIIFKGELKVDFDLLLKGILLGLSIAAPVGPIGVLCIRRTLSLGILNGFISGLGAATADSIYGGMAAFGITIISNFLLESQIYLHLIGGLFLMYLGYKTFRSLPAEKATEMNAKGLIGAYTSTLILTLTNPLTIMMFLGVFAGLGLGETTDSSACFIVLGVFIGSALWWLILSEITNRLRTKLNSSQLIWINRMSGLIILGFGLSSLIKL